MTLNESSPFYGLLARRTFPYFVDIVVIVERTFGFKIKPEEMGGVKTLIDFCDYIQSKVGDK